MPNRFNKNRIESHTTDLPTSDNIYIDIRIPNLTEERGIPAIYEQTRSIQVLDNPSNYYLSLVRWKVPAFELPLLIFPIQNNQADPNLSQYSITFETSTDIFQYFLFFVNRNSTEAPDNAITTQKPSAYYFVYEYQHMLDIINHALIMCHDNVTGKPAGSIPPYMTYDPTTKLFTFVAQLIQYGVTLTPTPVPPANPTTQPTYDADIKVYFNYKLFSLFNGLQTKTVPVGAGSTMGRDVQLLVADYNNNTISATEVGLLQNFSSIAFWTPVKQLLFLSELIPVNSEFTAVSDNSFRKILTDFEPVADSQQDIRTTLQYFPRGVYRLVDLIGTKPLFVIDLKVKWLDINGNEYFVDIAPFQQLTAKLLFVKRNLYKNDLTLYET